MSFDQNEKKQPQSSFTMQSVVSLGPLHLREMTIEKVIETDTNGENILALLQFRESFSSKSQKSTPKPGHFLFDDEVNVALDVFYYSNSSIRYQFSPRFTRGQLKLKIKILETEQKERERERVRNFRRNEQETLQRHIEDARRKLKLEKNEHYGAW